MKNNVWIEYSSHKEHANCKHGDNNGNKFACGRWNGILAKINRLKFKCKNSRALINCILKNTGWIVHRLLDSMVSHNDHLVSSLADGLFWFWLLCTSITVLVLFLVLFDASLRFIIGLDLGSSLVDVFVVRVTNLRCRGILLANKYTIIISYLGSILVERYTGEICIAVHVQLVTNNTGWLEESDCSIAKEDLLWSISFLFFKRLINIPLLVELFGLHIIFNKHVVMIDSDSSIQESTLNCAIQEFFNID